MADLSDLCLLSAGETSLAADEVDELIQARGSLKSVLGDEVARRSLFIGRLQSAQVVLARKGGSLAGYLMFQQGWQSPFRVGFLDFLRVHGRSALWRYPAFVYLEWRGSIYDFYIYSLKVQPRQRRQGVAKQLMLFAEAAAARRGNRHVTLEVNADNRAAIALYESLGYRRVSTFRLGWLSGFMGFGQVELMRKDIQGAS